MTSHHLSPHPLDAPRVKAWALGGLGTCPGVGTTECRVCAWPGCPEAAAWAPSPWACRAADLAVTCRDADFQADVRGAWQRGMEEALPSPLSSLAPLCVLPHCSPPRRTPAPPGPSPPPTQPPLPPQHRPHRLIPLFSQHLWDAAPGGRPVRRSVGERRFLTERRSGGPAECQASRDSRCQARFLIKMF